MIKPFLPLSALAGLALAITAQTSSAVTVDQDFCIDWLTGDLAGTESAGSFQYDSAALTGVGTENINLAAGLLALEATIDGNTYLGSDDQEFDFFPWLSFEDGAFVGFDWQIDDTPGAIGNFDVLNVVGMSAVYFGPKGSQLSEGEVYLKDGTGVPDGGSSALLLGIVLCTGAAAKRLKRG